MSKFHLKFSVVAVMMALLSACQHHPNTTTHPSAQPVVSGSLSERAKGQLTSAMKAHLAGERHAVAISRSQALPLYHDGSPDKGSDAFWGSIMKVGEFKRNHRDSNEQPYRTESEYLGWSSDSDEGNLIAQDIGANGDLPYLRYDDEQNNTPAETVSRQVAFADAYTKVDEQIRELADNTNGDIESFYKNTSTHTPTSTQLKGLTKIQANLKKQSAKLKKSAKGYQRQDLQSMNACVADYVVGLRGLTKSSPTSATLELLYQNYRTCAIGRVLDHTMSPSVYISQDYQEAHLKTASQLKQCQVSAVSTQRSLQKAGKTYAKDEKDYLDSYLDYAKCASDVLGYDSDDITDLDSAQDQLYPLRYVVSYGRFSQYDTQVDKYQGLSGWLQAYRDMKAQGTKPNNEESTQEDRPLSRFGIFGNMMGSMLDYMKQTPEQLTAQNIYQYNHTTVTSLSHHDPASRQATMLWSLDFESPTARQSAQLPMKLDFGTGVATADVSALLPVVAVVSPKHAPLPKDIPDGLMYFNAPPKLAKKIPSTVIYDAISKGVLLAMDELDSEKFTPVAGQDDFAKQIGASHTIKLQLGTKEAGQMYATIAKVVVSELNAYVDAHPDIYPDVKAQKPNRNKGIKKGDNEADKVKTLIKDFATLNMTYRSSDVGGLLQAIEGVAPFGIDVASYLYLDAQGKLIGTQTIADLQDELHDYRLKNTTQTRYDKAYFDAHRLSGQFHQAFKAPAQVDGVALIKSAVDEYRFGKQAQEARQSYESSAFEATSAAAATAEAVAVAASEAATSTTDR